MESKINIRLIKVEPPEGGYKGHSQSASPQNTEPVPIYRTAFEFLRDGFSPLKCKHRRYSFSTFSPENTLFSLFFKHIRGDRYFSEAAPMLKNISLTLLPVAPPDTSGLAAGASKQKQSVIQRGSLATLRRIRVGRKERLGRRVSRL